MRDEKKMLSLLVLSWLPSINTTTDGGKNISFGKVEYLNNLKALNSRLRTHGRNTFFFVFFNKSINVLLVLGQHREDSFSEKVFKWLNTILPKDLSGVLMTEAKSTVGWALGLNSRVQQVGLGNKRARIFKLHRVITAQWLHDFVWRTYGMMLYRAAAEVEIRLTLLPSSLDFLLAHKFVEMNEGLSEHITPKSPIDAYSWWLWRP